MFDLFSRGFFRIIPDLRFMRYIFPGIRLLLLGCHIRCFIVIPTHRAVALGFFQRLGLQSIVRLVTYIRFIADGQRFALLGYFIRSRLAIGFIASRKIIDQRSNSMAAARVGIQIIWLRIIGLVRQAL